MQMGRKHYQKCYAGFFGLQPSSDHTAQNRPRKIQKTDSEVSATRHSKNKSKLHVSNASVEDQNLLKNTEDKKKTAGFGPSSFSFFAAAAGGGGGCHLSIKDGDPPGAKRPYA